MTWVQPPEHLFALSVHVSEGRATVTLCGELDLSNTQRVYEQFRALVDDAVTQLVCDISELTFVDSTALSVFLSAHKRMEDLGGSFILRSPVPSVTRMFEIVGVLDHLNIESDPPDAP